MHIHMGQGWLAAWITFISQKGLDSLRAEPTMEEAGEWCQADARELFRPSLRPPH